MRFHRQHILPYAAYPDHDRPAVQMLIAIQSRKIVNPQILVTRNSAIHRCVRYGTVGAGEQYAKAILGKYRTLDQASKIAVFSAYVIWAVKEAVEGCGKYTTVTTLHGPQIRAASGFEGREEVWPDQLHSDMGWDELDDLEQYFRRTYAQEERERLWARINEWAERKHAERKAREQG